jgi:predicted transcriptional regulator
MKPTNFSKIIKDLQKAGYTNALIAHETGFSQTYIGQLEKGYRMQPSYDLGAKLIELQTLSKKSKKAYQDVITGADQKATAKLIAGLKKSQ